MAVFSGFDTMTVYGTTGAYYDIQGLSLQNGRWMNKADVDNHTYVVILNTYAATQLIGRTNCVGESISLDGKKYQIIGVLQDEQSGVSSTQSERMEAYIPYTSLTRLSDSVLYVTAGNGTGSWILGIYRYCLRYLSGVESRQKTSDRRTALFWLTKREKLYIIKSRRVSW